LGNLLKILGYLISALMVGCGILIISGFLMPKFAGGDGVRVMFGVVVLLYGVLRFVQTRMKKPERDER
jgi:hypothetical protein